MPHARPVARPWHLWPVALAGLAVYTALATDYILVRFGFETAAVLVLTGADAELAAHPVWLALAWGVAVWGGLVGAAMLMAREDGAAVALAFALIGTLVMLGHALAGLAAPPTLEAARAAGTGLALLAAFALLLWLYARVQKQRGVLT